MNNITYEEAENIYKDRKYFWKMKIKHQHKTFDNFYRRFYELYEVSSMFLNVKIDDVFFDKLINNNRIKAFVAGGTFRHFLDSETKDLDDILATMLLENNPKTNYNNKYIKLLFNDPNFFKTNGGDFCFKKSNQSYVNIDFGKYALTSGNKLALNYIYQDLQDHKKIYTEYIYNELSAFQLINVLNHYKNNDIDWNISAQKSSSVKKNKIKDISSLIYNKNFIFLFVNNNNNLSKNQKHILEMLFKNKDFFNKIATANKKEDIFTKNKEEKLKSKDFFVAAAVRKNTDFLNIMLNNGYIPTNNEIGLLHSLNINHKLNLSLDDSSEELELLKFSIIKQNIIDFINKANSDLKENLISKEDILILNKNYQKHKHSIKLMNLLKTEKSIKLLENNKITVSDAFILEKPQVLQSLYNKGLMPLNEKVEEKVFYSLLIQKEFNNNDLENSKVFVKNYLSKNSHKQKELIYNFFSYLTKTNQSTVFDSTLGELIVNMDFDIKDKAYFSTQNLYLFNHLSIKEKKDNYGSELTEQLTFYIKKYLKDFYESDNLNNKEYLIKDVSIMFQDHPECYKIIENNIENKNNKEFLVLIEKTLLSSNIKNDISKEPSLNKKRL